MNLIYLNERSLLPWCHTLEDQQMAEQVSKLTSSWAFDRPILSQFSPKQAQWILLRREAIGEPMRRQWLARMFRRAMVYGRLGLDNLDCLFDLEDPSMRVGLARQMRAKVNANLDLAYGNNMSGYKYALARATLICIIDSVGTGLFPRAAISHLLDLSPDEEQAQLIDTVEFDANLRSSINTEKGV